MTLRIGSKRGMTLVEILLAVVILSVGIAGVLQAYAVSVKTLGISRDHIDALCLLKEKMADIEQAALEQNGLSAGTSSGDFTGAFQDCTWESEAKPISEESLYELDLRVQLPDQSRRFSLATYLRNKDYAE